MKILFLLPAIGKLVHCHLGVAYLSAIARQRGHKTALLKVNRLVSANALVQKASSYGPDVVAVSAISNHWQHILNWIPILRQACPEAQIIFGGVHATVASESVAASGIFDAICVGEGDEAFGEYLDALAANRRPFGIPNIWVRAGTEYLRTDLRPFFQELDRLPFPDRTLFGNRTSMEILTGRGCPFDCSYCFNHVLKELTCGKYVRRRSIESVLLEIEQEMHATTVRRVVFQDDIFTLNSSWLIDFCAAYRKRIGLPMAANGRVGAIDETRVKALAEAGCDYLLVGVETGNEQLRRDVLGRAMSNEEIIAAFDLTKQYGLSTYAYYMIGIPGETEAMARETLLLHKRLKPDAGLQISVLYPYPGTRLHEIARQAGILSTREKDSYSGGTSTLNLPDLPPHLIREIVGEFERHRYNSSFSDRWIRARMPWVLPFAKLAWGVIGKERLLRWGKSVYDRLQPAIEFRESTLIH